MAEKKRPARGDARSRPVTTLGDTSEITKSAAAPQQLVARYMRRRFALAAPLAILIAELAGIGGCDA